MFTGLIEETGRVVQITPRATGIRLVIASQICARGTRVGDSIAVNGVCLTVVRRVPRRGGTHLHFDLLLETWTRTSLHQTSIGGAVNLERALMVNSRLGGHFVTGHVDDIGTITRWERDGKDHVLDLTAPRALRRYFVAKGSVAVDGISLTVAAVTRAGLRVWIIPHTYDSTALCERQVGDVVNLEADLLGKYVAQMLKPRNTRNTRKGINR